MSTEARHITPVDEVPAIHYLPGYVLAGLLWCTVFTAVAAAWADEPAWIGSNGSAAEVASYLLGAMSVVFGSFAVVLGAWMVHRGGGRRG